MQNLSIAVLSGALAIGAGPGAQASPTPGLSDLSHSLVGVDRSGIQQSRRADPLRTDAPNAQPDIVPAVTAHLGLTSTADLLARFKPKDPNSVAELTESKIQFNRIYNPDRSSYATGTLEAKAGDKLEMFFKATGIEDKASVIIKNSDGVVISQQVISTNADGFTHLTFKPPADGKYTIELKPGDVTAEKPVVQGELKPGETIKEKLMKFQFVLGAATQSGKD